MLIDVGSAYAVLQVETCGCEMPQAACAGMNSGRYKLTEESQVSDFLTQTKKLTKFFKQKCRNILY